MKKIFKKKIILFLLISLSFTNHAYSVDIPTVDDLNNQVPQLPEKKAPNASENLNQLNEKILTVDEDKILKVLVKDFKIDGNKRYNDELLLSLINENINKELDYNALLNVTTSLSNYYRSQGYLATAYLPPQDIKNGVVNIKITEAILGKITFNVDEGQKLNIILIYNFFHY